MPKSIKDRYDEAGNVGKVGSSSVPTRPLKGTYLVPVYDVDNSKGRVSKLDDLLADSDTAFKIMAHSGAYTIVEGTAKYDSAGNLLSASVVWADGSPGGIVRSTTGTTTSTVYHISKPGTTTRYLAADKSVDASGNTRGETWSETGFIAVIQSLLPFCFVFGESADLPPNNTGIQTLEVTGVGLTGDVFVEALGSFQVSLDDLTYGEKVAVSPDSPTPVYVKMTETDQGEYTGLLLFSATGAKTVSISVSGAIGDGTSGYPVPVVLPSMLVGVSSDLTLHYKQYCDIDMEGKTWTPLGTYSPLAPFEGEYDGNGFKISNYTYDDGAASFTPFGFFSYVTGTIKNLQIESPSLSTDVAYCGLLAGYLASSAKVSGCRVSGSLNVTAGIAGGAIGAAVDGATVSECASDVDIVLDGGDPLDYVGGFIGNHDNNIDSCCSRGTIKGTFAGRVGGFTGGNTGGSAKSITNCYSLVACDVALSTLGGFVGFTACLSEDYDYCYAGGEVSGAAAAGGFVGLYDKNGVVYPVMAHGCFWDTDSTGQASDGGGEIEGGSGPNASGKTSKEMIDSTTFAAWGVAWDVLDGRRPMLAWEL